MIINLYIVPLSLALSLLRDLDSKISPDVNQGFELLLNWMILISVAILDIAKMEVKILSRSCISFCIV